MNEIRVTLRVPREVYEAVKAEAQRECRSLNAQIVVMLARKGGRSRGCDGCGSFQGPWYRQWLVGETPGVRDRPGAWLCERCMRKPG